MCRRRSGGRLWPLGLWSKAVLWPKPPQIAVFQVILGVGSEKLLKTFGKPAFPSLQAH